VPTRTNNPIEGETPDGNGAFPNAHGHDHHVTGEQLLTLEHDPIDCVSLLFPNCNEVCMTHITRPTGKTKPANILTRPGFEDVRDGEPPAMTSLRRPPKDKNTPATNCATRA
jgi:hypothetical protein